MGHDEALIERATQGVAGAFQDLGIEPELIESRAWYAESFARAGDWDAWVWATVMEKPYGSRKPTFAAFVLMSDRVGKANAGIALLALQNRRPVFCWDGQTVRRVSKLRKVSDSWKDGWQPVTV